MSLNCPGLNENNKVSFNWNYASRIENVRRRFPINDYIVFSNPSHCLYAWGHRDLVGIFISGNEGVFNAVKDNNTGSINKFIEWVHTENLGLRFIITDVKNYSLTLYYLKADENQNFFKDRLRTITNPIYTYMSSKAELTDYILNFENSLGNLGKNIEGILDTFIISLNDRLKRNANYDNWKKPKLYKKGGLSLKQMWKSYSPISMSPYLDQQTLLKLTSKNSDYDVTVLFHDDLPSQDDYIKIINDIFTLITNSIRDEAEYRRIFVDISNEITRFGGGSLRIPISNMKNIYDNLPAGPVPIFNVPKQQIYIDIVTNNRLNIQGYSCVNLGHRSSSGEKMKKISPEWNRVWNNAWGNIKLPFEFSLKTINVNYPSSNQTRTCIPEELKKIDTSFTLFRCLGTAQIIGGNTVQDTNFEILDISCDSNYEKVNIESRLQIPLNSTTDEKDIYMNYSTLLYDSYSMITDAETELSKTEKRCTRFDTMLTIYDKLTRDGTVVDVTSFFKGDRKLRFVQNYLKFCRNFTPDTSYFNSGYIRNNMKFEDFAQLSKPLNKLNINLQLRKNISQAIRNLNQNQLTTRLDSVKTQFNKPIFLQGGTKLLILVKLLSQRFADTYYRIQDLITPTDFDFFAFTEDEDYPIDITSRFNSYSLPLLKVSSDEWENLAYEQREIIRVRSSIESRQFDKDETSSTDTITIYNHIMDSYYSSRNVKSSRPYLVCAKTGFVGCKLDKNTITEINYLELNIVNLKWAEKIQTANKLGITGSQSLLLQAVYPYIYSLLNNDFMEVDDGSKQNDIIENYAFLLSSYMNYVYNLKPINSLLRFLVVSIYLIEKENKTTEDLSNIFDDFRRSVQPVIRTRYNYYNKKQNLVVEKYFNETAKVDVQSYIDRDSVVDIPFNPFKNYTDVQTIHDDLQKLLKLVSLESLARDADVIDKSCSGYPIGF